MTGKGGKIRYLALSMIMIYLLGGCGTDLTSMVSPDDSSAGEEAYLAEGEEVPAGEELSDGEEVPAGEEPSDGEEFPDGVPTADGEDSALIPDDEKTTDAADSVVGEEVEETIDKEAAVETNDNIVTIKISAAGDVTLGNHEEQEYAYSFRQTYDNESNAYFLENVQHIFGKDDCTIVNFEGVLTYAEEKQEKDFNMKGDPDYIDILTEGSVEAVSFANNHRRDYLEQGSRDTVALFEEKDIVYAYDRITGVYETKGIKIGIVSVNETSQGTAVERYLKEGIDSLQEDDADIIIAYCHWGIEYENYPEDYQQELGRKCIDWGADLVLGSHPHVLQGIEVYKGHFIVYSLANFCFGGNRNPKDKDTMIFTQTFTFVDGIMQKDTVAQVVPCSVSSVPNRNDFRPTPAEGDEYTRILERINTYSEPFGTRFAEDGYYIERQVQR